eukprot:jgi/Chlat1/4009/Chrsp26S04073
MAASALLVASGWALAAPSPQVVHARSIRIKSNRGERGSVSTRQRRHSPAVASASPSQHAAERESQLRRGAQTAAQALAAAAAVVFGGGVAHAAVTSGDVKDFNGKSGVHLTIPKDWVVAINRPAPSRSTQPETLALLGNFTAYDTVSVLQAPSTGFEAATSAAEVADKLALKGNVRTAMISAARREASTPGESAYTFEYSTETCRGNTEEAVGGDVLCLAPRDGQPLPTVKRHHITAAFVRNGLVYTASASCVEDRWAAAGRQLQAIVASFTLST